LTQWFLGLETKALETAQRGANTSADRSNACGVLARLLRLPYSTALDYAGLAWRCWQKAERSTRPWLGISAWLRATSCVLLARGGRVDMAQQRLNDWAEHPVAGVDCEELKNLCPPAKPSEMSSWRCLLAETLYPIGTIGRFERKAIELTDSWLSAPQMETTSGD